MINRRTEDKTEDRIEALEREVATWKAAARHYHLAESYYRSLLDECAKHLSDVFAAEDGSTSSDPLVARLSQKTTTRTKTTVRAASRTSSADQADQLAFELLMHAILVREGPPWNVGLSYAFGDGAEHFLNQWMEDTFGQRIPDAAEEGDALRDWELDVGRRLIEREGPAW